MFSYLLRPGNADAKQGCFGLLKRVLPKLRQAFPGAVIRLRLDSGFSGPDIYQFMEAHECEYVVGMAKNPVLETLAEPAMAVVREDADQDIETICYDDDLYAARSWSHKRRVIIKGQITYHSGRQPKENPRFLITNIKRSPRHIYEKIYCARGDSAHPLPMSGSVSLEQSVLFLHSTRKPAMKSTSRPACLLVLALNLRQAEHKRCIIYHWRDLLRFG